MRAPGHLRGNADASTNADGGGGGSGNMMAGVTEELLGGDVISGKLGNETVKYVHPIIPYYASFAGDLVLAMIGGLSADMELYVV